MPVNTVYSIEYGITLRSLTVIVAVEIIVENIPDLFLYCIVGHFCTDLTSVQKYGYFWKWSK